MSILDCFVSFMPTIMEGQLILLKYGVPFLSINHYPDCSIEILEGDSLLKDLMYKGIGQRELEDAEEINETWTYVFLEA